MKENLMKSNVRKREEVMMIVIRQRRTALVQYQLDRAVFCPSSDFL